MHLSLVVHTAEVRRSGSRRQVMDVAGQSRDYKRRTGHVSKAGRRKRRRSSRHECWGGWSATGSITVCARINRVWGSLEDKGRDRVVSRIGSSWGIFALNCAYSSTYDPQATAGYPSLMSASPLTKVRGPTIFGVRNILGLLRSGVTVGGPPTTTSEQHALGCDALWWRRDCHQTAS